MGILWGFVSALCYGSADFVARGVSIKLTPYHALFYIHLVSGALMLAVILITGIPATATVSALILAIALGLLNTLGTLLLYRALTIGKISLVSPVTSTFGGVTLLLALLTGDAISLGGVFSLLLMLAGIAIVSTVRDDPQKSTGSASLRGLPEALVAALVLGLNYWALHLVVASIGPYLPTLVGRVMTLILLPLLARPLKQSVAMPPRSLWFNIAVVGIITTGGEIAYNIGIQGTTPGIVAVLSSLFSPVTVLLALIFLRERLARHQWIGVGIIFVATLLVGIFQNFGTV